jgi:formate-dependent nitrite reductase cytochrome c552 subunit
MSCHDSHDFNTRKAAVDACLNCHDDNHSKAYKSSPHYELWQQVTSGKIAEDAGVSCATCHLPRLTVKHNGEKRTLVQHNQNHNLRPNEKMIRDTCLSCHGLGFSIDALADPKLIANNFNGLPQKNIPSIAMAMKREKEKAAEKRNKSGDKADKESKTDN